MFLNYKSTNSNKNKKNSKILISTVAMPLSFGEVTPVITVNTIIPKMSSIIAAPNIDVPTFPFNFPISFNVSTEILTDVAVKITPTKTPF